MRAATLWLCAFALGLAPFAPEARAEQSAPAPGLDWEVHEEPAGPVVSWLRGVRDGTVGLCDDLLDLQLALFSEAALDAGALVGLGSDTVGLVDDNPVTEHVFEGVASKSLAKTAWLLHLSGSEAILGSHGLETETWLSDQLDTLNPLLDPEDEAPGLPLEPTAFVGEALVHTDVYTARIPGSVLLPAAVADLLIRPVGNVVRIVGFHAAADRLEAAGNGLVRRGVR